jgi:hypothetical protein
MGGAISAALTGKELSQTAPQALQHVAAALSGMEYYHCYNIASANHSH